MVTSLSSSTAFMMSSTATTLIVIVGIVTSCSISLVACVAGLPATSFTSAVMVSVGSNACASAAGTSKVHVPLVTVVVYVSPFKTTVTVCPSSAVVVPFIVTSVSSSKALITSSLATTPIVMVGGVIS